MLLWWWHRPCAAQTGKEDATPSSCPVRGTSKPHRGTQDKEPRPLVGASLKSRSTIENCWFSNGTTPRSRGEDFKTQNGKNKSEHIAFRNCRIYRRSRDGWRENILGRRRRHFAAKEAAPPTLRTYGSGGGAFVGNTYDRRAHGFHTMENFSPIFPQHGKYFRDFSTLWKIFGRFFHAMEKVFGIFPHNGKNVSTVWKTRF